MSEIEKRLTEFPLSVQEKINTIFGSLEKFYAVVYLIAKNEHMAQEEKTEQGQARLQVIHTYLDRIRYMLAEEDLPGNEIVADITSDYLEDYVNYREKDFGLSDEEFITIIKRIN